MKKYSHKPGWAFTAGFLSLSLLGACSAEEQAAEETATAWDEIQEEGVLEVGTSGTLLATSFHDEETNELTGFEVEVAREVAERLELDVEFSEMGFDEMLTSVKNGQLDMAANDIEITEEREKEFAFSDAIKYSYGVAVVREDDLSGIETLEDVEGKKAAGAATSVYMDISRELGAIPVTYDNASNEVYLRDVSIGRTDVILNDYYLSLFGVSAFPELNITIHPDIKFNPSSVGLVMNEENTELVENVNRVLTEMREDGTLTELSKEFFGGEDVSQKPDIE